MKPLSHRIVNTGCSFSMDPNLHRRSLESLLSRCSFPCNTTTERPNKKSTMRFIKSGSWIYSEIVALGQTVRICISLRMTGPRGIFGGQSVYSGPGGYILYLRLVVSGRVHTGTAAKSLVVWERVLGRLHSFVCWDKLVSVFTLSSPHFVPSAAGSILEWQDLPTRHQRLLQMSYKTM